MHLIKKIVLLSALGFGISHAGTVPCNGFKIEFKNTSHQNIVIDEVYFAGGHATTLDPLHMEVNKQVLFTVNQTMEGQPIWGEFLFHTTTEPYKELKLNFNLTNKNMICEVSDTFKQGALNIDIHRVLGGLYLPIKD
jgi:hypothetical protein